MNSPTGERLEEARNATLESLRKSLDKLLANNIDQFEVLSLAQRLSVNLENEESFSKQKYLVQKSLVEQLLKNERDNMMYNRILDETNQNLGLRKKPAEYLCCLVGCLFRTEKHKLYIQHLKQVHSTYQELVCNFKLNCRRQFSKFDDLLGHVKDFHSNINCPSVQAIPIIEDEACKCDLVACRGRKFGGIQELITHVVNFHNQEPRECIFEQCSVKFTAGKVTTARKHFADKHKKVNKLKLKAKYKIVPLLVEPTEEAFNVLNEVGTDVVNVGDMLDDHDLYTEEDIETLNNPLDNKEKTGEGQDFFMMQYADFLNRMTSMKYVPYKTVQEISTEYLEKSIKSQEVREKRLRESLKQVPNLSDEMVEKIVKDSLGEDDFIKAQQELSSVYKREKFIKEHFKYVAPVEIILNSEEHKNGAPKDCLHYVPVTQSFKNLMEDKSLCEVLEKKRNEVNNKSKDVIRDFTDGEAFMKNQFFKENPGAFCAHFYSDSVELSNPLGAAKGKHKINQVFYTLAQIPKEQRSKIDRIQLALVYKDRLVKKYGFKVIFKPLIDDLKKLEEGITVDFPIEKKVQLGLLAYSGDNLESHSLGGFSCCFSSKSICRFCHASYDQLQSHIHDYDAEEPHDYWTVTEYDRICDSLESNVIEDEQACTDQRIVEGSIFFEEDDDPSDEDGEEDVSDGTDDSQDDDMTDSDDSETISNTFGLRARCPLNQLKSFHAVLALPPDCMHDWMEGVLAQASGLILRIFVLTFIFQDLFGVIKIFVEKRWFTMEEYNTRLRQFKFSSYESADRPQDVPAKGKKMPGKAISQWVHARNFPLIMKPFVQNNDDNILELALLLVEITGRITAYEFREHEILLLEEKVTEYLDKRKEIFEVFGHLLGTAKPKGSRQNIN